MLPCYSTVHLQMLSTHEKKRFGPDISRTAEMFPPIKDRIYSLTQNTIPKAGSRSAVFRTPRLWKVHYWLLSPKRKLLRDLPVKAVEGLIFFEEYITLPTAGE